MVTMLHHFQQPPQLLAFGNYTHILRRTTIVADNLSAQDLAGRNDELSYQLAKRGKELKRDIEAVLTDNNAQVQVTLPQLVKPVV